MEKKVNLSSNTVFNGIKSVFGIIYPLITFPYINRILGIENVGKINFGSSIISYFSLIASLGVTTYAVRECAKVRENKQEIEKVSSQIYSISVISTFIAYVALAITLIVARPLDNYRLLICIQSLTILFATVGADWINAAMEDFKYIALRTVGMQVISLLLMFIFIRKQEDYIVFAVICVIAASGANIINLFYRRRFCKIKFTFDMDLTRHLPSIILLFTTFISQTIYSNSDITILGLVKGDYDVGIYSVSVKIYTLVNTMIGGTITPVLSSRLSSLYGNNEKSAANDVLKYGINFITILAIPCVLGINILSRNLVVIAGGEEYLEASTSLQILSASLVFSLLGGFCSNLILIPIGKEKIIFFSSLFAACCNIVLNLIFIPIWGVNAAATTTAISELVSLGILFKYSKKEIHLDINFIMLLKPIISGLVMAIVCFIVAHYINNLVLGGLISTIIGSITYGIMLWILKDNFFISFIKEIVGRKRQ